MWLAFLAATVLTWIPPTLNDDGSLLTDLASYDIWYGCEQSGLYDRVDTLLAPATTHTVTDIRGTCYFAAKAVNSQGVSSVYSEEQVRQVSVELPGPVVDTTITWRESVMAAPTFVNLGTFAVGSGTVVPGLPSGWAENDIFLLHIEGEAEDGDADGQGDFGGTLIGTVVSGAIGPNDRARQTVYWKRAGTSESAPTVDDAGNHTHAVISAWRGCITTGSPIDASQPTSQSVNTTSHSADGVTTNVADTMIVVSFVAGDDVDYSAWANVNLVSVNDAGQNKHISGSDGTISIVYGVKASAGATGATTATTSATEEEAHWTIALKPPGGAPPSVVLGRHPIDGGMNPVQGGMQ